MTENERAAVQGFEVLAESARARGERMRAVSPWCGSVVEIEYRESVPAVFAWVARYVSIGAWVPGINPRHAVENAAVAAAQLSTALLKKKKRAVR